jgi:hypothetical protein
MAKPSHSVFARRMYSVVRMLMQNLKSWLVITFRWNTRVLSLVLKLKFPSKGVSKLD